MAKSEHATGGAWYFFGFVGAFLWFWHQAEGLGEHLVGILKSFVWPAFFVYEVFERLNTPG